MENEVKETETKEVEILNVEEEVVAEAPIEGGFDIAEDDINEQPEEAEEVKEEL